MTRAADLPTYADALETVLQHARLLPEERVGLADAAGRVLRADVVADRDQPPFDRSAMDGFAVRAGRVETGRLFAIIGEVAAGGAAPDADPDAGVLRIATGAAVPGGFDAVIPVERARVDADGVAFDAPPEPGACIHRRGADARAGRVVIAAGTRLGPRHVGIAAAVGRVQVPVTRLPRVALLTSGDEVRAPDTATADLEPQQIRNSNGPMLRALLEGLGAPPAGHRHVTDDEQATLDAARDALEESDVVVTTGGVSVGRRDLLPWAWESLGLEKILHGVAMQPGRPVFVARAADGGRLVIGLPGNPVSVLVTAHLFLRPVLRRAAGLEPRLPWRRVTLAEPVKPNARRQAFRPARLSGPDRGAAVVLPWQGSGDLVHTAEADGLLDLPAGSRPLDAGTALRFLDLDGGA